MLRSNLLMDETMLGTKVMESTGIKDEIKKKLSLLRSKIGDASTQGVLKLKNSLISLEQESRKLMKDIELIDTKSSYKLKTVNNKILFLMRSIKDATIKKSGVLKELDECLSIIDKVDIDNSDVSWIDKNIKPFQKFEYISLDSVTDPVSVVTAPLLISLPAPLHATELAKLSKELKLVGSYGTFYSIKKANFLIINKNKLRKDTDLVEYSNMILSKISKKTTSMIIPIHDISMETSKWYVVFLIPAMIAKEVTSYLTDRLSDFDIYIKS